VAQMLFTDNPAKIIRSGYVSAEPWQPAAPKKWWQFWGGDR
jgi:hypothetical protein